MVQRCLLAMVCLLALALPAATAQAKTCADYPNQAAAQKAHDTRDADGDGVYCEDLPCPCLKPGSTAKAPAPAPAPATKPSVLGITVDLAPVTKTSGCRIHDGLPDARCTPGAWYSKVTKRDVCRPGYAKAVRNVSQSAKDAVYGEYGMPTHFDGADGEVDHLVSLELGGSNARANLFPESATPRPGSHEKDKLENRLHSEVCEGRTSLRHAQRLIATDWVAAYHARFR